MAGRDACSTYYDAFSLRSLGSGLCRTCIRHSPYGAGAIIRHVERALLARCDSYEAPPNPAIWIHKPGHEILIFATRHAVLQGNAHYLVPGLGLSIGRAVKSKEEVLLVLLGK